MDFHYKRAEGEAGEAELPSSHLQCYVPMASLMQQQQQHPDGGFTEEEIHVAAILLELPHLVDPAGSRPVVSWGGKRKRSSIPVAASPTCNGEEDHLKVKASSPATPLSFSPSDEADADLKTKVLRRRDFKKKSIKEIKEMATALYTQQIQLKHEISKVSDYCSKLKAMNLQLKQRQSELGFFQTRYQIDLNQCKSLDLFENPKIPEKQPPTINHQLTWPAVDRCNWTDDTAENSQFPQPSFASSGFGFVQENRCRVAVFDLNAPAEETVGFDITRQFPFHLKSKAAIAAEARKRRIGINRVKSSLALKQPRFR